MKTRIENVKILTMDGDNRVYEDGCVLVDGDRIEKVGDREEAAGWSGGAEAAVLDGRGGILIPGLINTHCHVSMMPFRTLGDDCADRLRRFLFPLENDAMTRRLVYRAARYGICEMLLAGVTTFLDMYYFEDEVAKACEELGMRGFLGETVIGQATCEGPEPYTGLAYGEEFIRQWQGSRLVKPLIAPHATYSVSPEMLKKSFELAEKYDTLYTIHVCEMEHELKKFREEYGQTPVEFLADLGVLGRRTVAAHCVYMTERDIDLFAEHQVGVAHCIGSNTKGGRGVAPVPAMEKRGVAVGFGTDGASSGNTLDLFTLFKLFANFQKTEYHDRTLFPAKDIVRTGTMGGARALGMERELGSIEEGKKADLVIVETDSVNMFPCYNPYSALVYSANASNVDTVMVDGEVLVRGKKFVRADFEAIRRELAEEMGPFMKAAENYGEMI